MQVMIPRWVYNRIAVLLIAAQGGAKIEDYIVWASPRTSCPI
jgi:hypothetical protein